MGNGQGEKGTAELCLDRGLPTPEVPVHGQTFTPGAAGIGVGTVGCGGELALCCLWVPTAHRGVPSTPHGVPSTVAVSLSNGSVPQ